MRQCVLVDYPELTIEDGKIFQSNFFEIWFLVLEIFMIFIKQVIFVKSVNCLFK